jgi:protein O-GlcNAc transferase
MIINEVSRLAVQSYQSGDLHQAEHFCKLVLKKQPNNAEVLSFLGIIYVQLKNYDLAIQYIKKSLHFNPGNADAYLALGIVMQQKGLADEAITYYQKTISLNPSNSEAYNSLGNVFKEKGFIDDAMNTYRKAIQIRPDFDEAYANLGNVLNFKAQYDEAIACFQKTIQLNPHHVQAYYGLITALVNKWQLDEAIEICNRILQFDTSDIFAYYTLGNILMTRGKLDEAEIYFKQAIQIKPDALKPYQALLMLMSYSPKYDAQTILFEHVRFAKQFEEPLHSKIYLHTNDRRVTRRLRIGYVSPDFKIHPVPYFIEPVLISHNKDLFEIFCYSDVLAPDEVTNRIKGYALQWRNIAGLSNEKVAELIRKEKVDILVDLAGHTGGVDRILLFAHKPAPVQVSWIGYPSTTGFSAIDYRIVDGYTDPSGMTEQFYTEKLIYLPEIFLCYLPDKDSPDVNTLPALTSVNITFGSFNNFVKVIPEIMMIWANILRAVPNSRLIMKHFSFLDKTTCSYVKNLFITEGIEAERIQLLSLQPSTREHLNLYNKVDIGLDTFPYHGTTTTCDALWMGVPVVSLAGDTPASRVGISLLSNVGLQELIAGTEDEYIQIAVKLANDIHRLQNLRSGLRGRMAHSPLTDAKTFTVNLEKCYRMMWENWCKSV